MKQRWLDVPRSPRPRPALAVRPVLAVLAAALVAVAAPGPITTPAAAAVAKPKLVTGMSYGDRLTWMSDAELNAALDDAVALGVRSVRTDFGWAAVQDEGPTTWTWRYHDRVVAAARKRGLEVLPVLAYPPAWARVSGCYVEACAPADPKAFATFAAAAVRRYAPRGVRTWEIWNEQNSTAFYKPAPDPAGYTKLLVAASGAIRAADPKAYVLMGGLAAMRTENGNIGDLDFLERVCALGGCKRVDAIAYHPYTYPYLASFNASWGTSWNRVSTTERSLRGILGRAGLGSVPVWLTEYGAPTGGPGNAADGSAASLARPSTHVTEARQAQIARDSVAAAATAPGVSALFWYSYQDLSTDRASNENFYGLRRTDGSPKPAWKALRAAIATAGLRSAGSPADGSVASSTGKGVLNRLTTRFRRPM